MKKFKFILLIFSCFSILFSCSELEVPLEDMADADLKKGAKGKVTVMPSSEDDVLQKAHEDWANISEALQNACPGDVVQLGEGTFYLHESIIQWNFSGILKGAGIGKTIIRTAPGVAFDVSKCPQKNWTFETNDGAYMICFAFNHFEGERTVAVSDFSIIADEPATTTYRRDNSEECNSMEAIMVINTELDNNRMHPVKLNVEYKNLSVTGEWDPKYIINNYSLFTGLAAHGFSNGVFEVKNVYVENASGCIKPHAFFGPDAKIIIKDCQLKNCYHGIYAFYDHSWTIQDNRIEDCVMGVALLKRGPKMETWDGPEGESYIKDNWIQFNGDDGMGIGMQFAQNVEVKDNVFSGYSKKYGGMVGLFGNNWIVKDNDLCEVSSLTIMLIGLKNSVIKDNYNQVIAGSGATDPSNTIGDGKECY